MPNPRRVIALLAPLGTPGRASVSIAAAAASSWALAAWIARQDSAEAISASDALFALALLATYSGASALFVLRAGPRARLAVFHVVLRTFAVGISVAILELPALLGWMVWDKTL